MKTDISPKKIQEILERGVEKIYPSRSALKQRLSTGKPMKIYTGFDATAPSLHIGHLVSLNKLAQLQALGHQIFFLIGDFTTLIGDPTGHSTSRPQLTVKEVLANSCRFSQEASKILSFQGKNPARLVYNSQWIDKLKARDLIQLTSNFTVQQMITRNMFQERMKKGKPIFIHEFLYPIFQAYDSVALEADLEIGGNDQTFNMLCGRSLVKDMQHREKIVMTLQLLTDASGAKMSKTDSNAVFLSDSPQEIYGKVMSYPDELIESAFYLCTKIPYAEAKKIGKNIVEKKISFRDAKARLAWEIVSLNKGKFRADQSAQEFQRVFKEKEVPINIPSLKLAKKPINIVDLLIRINLASSRSEAKRLIVQGGIQINQKVEKRCDQEIKITKGMIIQRGKRKFVRIQ